jgi:hypothetical protein
MAEVIGLVASGMTIAGLFKICVEAFDLIQTGRHQELDLKKLTLRLNIEKCRLYTWGQAMGLTNLAESSSEDRQHPLDLYEFRDLVKETLEVIFRLFNDTHKIKDAYGCITYTEQDGSQLHPSEAEEAGPVENLATSFANFKIGENKRKRCSNVMQKAKWVVCDRKKFNGLINEVKDLINALQDITKSVATAADQNLMMRKGISDIRNVETLELVAEVCEVDYQDLSDAASMRAETVSMATTVRNGIAAWTDSVDAGNAIDVESEDLESLTITELKHRLLQLLKERRAAPAAQASVAPQCHTPSLKPQLASTKCENQSYLSSCALEFCSPHALPSQCWAAHTKMELIEPSRGPIVCPHCNATKLHLLASKAQRTELWYFKKFLYDHRFLLGECDRYGNSCAHFAASSGASLAQLEALASAGAPMKLSNNAGQTFLHVLNTKRYNHETLPPILQWALQEKGAMTKRDFQNRTVWHCMFQHGISPDVFVSILPCVYRHKDDMMILDSEDHTPLGCLKLYWRRTGEMMAIDYLNLLQSSGCLPVYFAANRTLPLGDVICAGAVAKLPTIPEISFNVSRLTIGAPTKRHDPNESTKNGVKELLSTYKNGGTLECNTIVFLSNDRAL